MSAALRVRLEPMRPADVDAVAAIEAGWQSRPWSPEVFRAELGRDDRAYVVAHDPAGGAVVGYGGITVAAGEAHVMTIAVAPSHRRRGVGRRLLVALVRAARERDATGVTLEVRESNDAALRLYEQVGFVSSGVRPGYYSDTGEGARILWLHDLDALTGLSDEGD